MVRLQAFGKTMAVLGVALAAAVAVCLLPENPYQRWQLLDGTIHGRARWIYERTHFDPTPIDVAFVGPSRMGTGINAPRMEKELAAAGTSAHVVNFSLPEGGRNIADVIVEEMLSEKTPKLLVIGVIEKPSRFGHPAYKYIAPASLLAAPGYAGNIQYFNNLLYLPYRKMRLGVADLSPGLAGLTKAFDRARYGGSSVDTTGNLVRADGTVVDRSVPAPLPQLNQGVETLERGTVPPILSARYADVEFGDERHYVRRIVRAARANGVPVAFLFIPYYTGPSKVQEADFYNRYGALWNAGFLASHEEWYVDYAHLTTVGAEQLTDWVAPQVAARLRQSGESYEPQPAAAPRGDRPGQ